MTPQPNARDFIYRTSHLHEADLVANELQRLDIAFYRAQEGPLGVQWAMPVWAAWEPGTCFLVIVPGPHARRAKRVIGALPVSHEKYPGVWRRGMTPKQKRFWRIMAWAWLILTATGLVVAIVNALRE